MKPSIFLLLCCSWSIYGQINTSDLQLLDQFSPTDHTYQEHHIQLGFQNQNLLLRYSFGALLYLYQSSISTQISASCLYEKSCSKYSKSLFDHYVFHKALFCSADRILRCDRVSATDISPYKVNADGKAIEDYTYYQFSENE